MIDREIISEKPVRVEYSLTEHGESLQPVIQEMAKWGQEHLTAAADEESSIVWGRCILREEHL